MFGGVGVLNAFLIYNILTYGGFIRCNTIISLEASALRIRHVPSTGLDALEDTEMLKKFLSLEKLTSYTEKLNIYLYRYIHFYIFHIIS